MTQASRNVLFICTGNSARSIIAEGIVNALGKAHGFSGYSAGSHPRGEVHPLALKTLSRYGIAVEGFRSKSWEAFAGADAPPMDFVFTVCDNAAGEVCPMWPGQPMTAHWGVPDPAAVEGTDAVKEKAFLDTFMVLRRRIEILLALPLSRLDALAIQREITNIGKQ